MLVSSRRRCVKAGQAQRIRHAYSTASGPLKVVLCTRVRYFSFKWPPEGFQPASLQARLCLVPNSMRQVDSFFRSAVSGTARLAQSDSFDRAGTQPVSDSFRVSSHTSLTIAFSWSQSCILIVVRVVLFMVWSWVGGVGVGWGGGSMGGRCLSVALGSGVRDSCLGLGDGRGTGRESTNTSVVDGVRRPTVDNLTGPASL